MFLKEKARRRYVRRIKHNVLSLGKFMKLHDAYITDFEKNEYRILRDVPYKDSIYKNKAMNIRTREPIDLYELYIIARNVRDKNKLIIAKRQRLGTPLFFQNLELRTRGVRRWRR